MRDHRTRSNIVTRGRKLHRFYFYQENWTWIQDELSDCRPRVELVKGQPRVTFFTFGALGGERMTLFVDTYSPDTYTFESEETEIAYGCGG